jgi:hypothetical protein
MHFLLFLDREVSEPFTAEDAEDAEKILNYDTLSDFSNRFSPETSQISLLAV